MSVWMCALAALKMFLRFRLQIVLADPLAEEWTIIRLNNNTLIQMCIIDI